MPRTKHDVKDKVYKRIKFGIETYTDQHGVQKFEKDPSWDPIKEIEDELIDAIIYASCMSYDLNTTQVVNLATAALDALQEERT